MTSTQSSTVANTTDNMDAAQYNNLRADMLALLMKESIEVTISSGSITLTSGQTFYRVDTEGDAAADDLDSISGGSEGDIVVLIYESSSRDITLKHGTGNIQLGGAADAVIPDGGIVLVKRADTSWYEIMRGGGGGAAEPSGSIVLADTACPNGYTRFSALDDKFPRGAASYGGTGGASTHTHTYDQIEEHNHGIGSLALDTCSTHRHSWSHYQGGSSNEWVSFSKNPASTITTYTNPGDHTHTLSGNVDTTGDASGTTDSASSLPPYLDMVFCKKD